MYNVKKIRLINNKQAIRISKEASPYFYKIPAGNREYYAKENPGLYF